MELFREINKEKGKTIVQVTHSAESAKFGQRTIFIRDGRFESTNEIERVQLTSQQKNYVLN